MSEPDVTQLDLTVMQRQLTELRAELRRATREFHAAPPGSPEEAAAESRVYETQCRVEELECAVAGAVQALGTEDSSQ